MKKLLILLGISASTLLFTSCDKENVTPTGRYSGTFTRSSPTSNTVTSNVTLEIDGNTFKGSSNMENYPAICNGTLDFSRNTLKVTNKCMFTANFDWTYIFKGEYEVEVSGNTLRIIKRYPNDFADVYNLEKVREN